MAQIPQQSITVEIRTLILIFILLASHSLHGTYWDATQPLLSSMRIGTVPRVLPPDSPVTENCCHPGNLVEGASATTRAKYSAYAGTDRGASGCSFHPSGACAERFTSIA